MKDQLGIQRNVNKVELEIETEESDNKTEENKEMEQNT